MRVLIILAALIVAIFQVSVMAHTEFLGGIPNLGIAVGVTLFTYRRRSASFWFLVAQGLFIDLLAPSSPGFFTAGALALYGVLALIASRIEPSPLIAFFGAGVGTLVVDIVWMVKARALTAGLIEALYTAILTAVLLVVARRFIKEERIAI